MATSGVEGVDREEKGKSGPKPSPRALAAWQSLFADRPSVDAADSAASDERAEAEAEASPSPRAETADGDATGAQAQPGDRAARGPAPQITLDVAAPSPEPASEVSAAPTRAVKDRVDDDRPASPFHVYEWVLAKLEARPSTSFLQLRRLGERGNFTVSEGHYKRARREIDGRITELRAPQIDALVDDTLAIVRKALGEVRGLRAAAREIAEICDEALAGDYEDELSVDIVAADDVDGAADDVSAREQGEAHGHELGEAGASA